MEFGFFSLVLRHGVLRNSDAVLFGGDRNADRSRRPRDLHMQEKVGRARVEIESCNVLRIYNI